MTSLTSFANGRLFGAACGVQALERCVELLAAVGKELHEASQATACLDSGATEEHMERIARICEQLAASRDYLSALGEDERLRAAALEVARALQRYRALIRRSRPTINALLNVHATTAVAYGRPGASTFSFQR